MKRKLFFTGALTLALALGLALAVAGCGGDDGGGTKKYTVTFVLNGGTLAGGQRVQEVEEKKYAAIPTVTPPAGKEADGWTSNVASIPDPDYPITADVTFTAKWKDKGATPDTPDTTDNPLLGAWYTGGTANDPDELLIFSGSSGGKQYFYGLWDVYTEPSTNTSNKLLHIEGEQLVYEVKGNTLTVKEYTNSKGEEADVAFTRIEGSTKTDEHDVWYTANRTNTDLYRTILVIKTNNVTFTARGPGSWDRWEYTPDTSRNRIDWKDDNTTTPYSLDGSTLTIPSWGDYTKTSL
ncbi:MAG: InlB B-repeat-containing protein [Treponema sp.]|jgi:hypothetical protein|nr:InlB B-repeat-containing protein [Treponema sp.]